MKEISPGGMKTDMKPPTVASGAVVETCIACLHSDQNTDKTATMLRFANN